MRVNVNYAVSWAHSGAFHSPFSLLDILLPLPDSGNKPGMRINVHPIPGKTPEESDSSETALEASRKRAKQVRINPGFTPVFTPLSSDSHLPTLPVTPWFKAGLVSFWQKGENVARR